MVKKEDNFFYRVFPSDFWPLSVNKGEVNLQVHTSLAFIHDKKTFLISNYQDIVRSLNKLEPFLMFLLVAVYICAH